MFGQSSPASPSIQRRHRTSRFAGTTTSLEAREPAVVMCCVVNNRFFFCTWTLVNLYTSCVFLFSLFYAFCLFVPPYLVVKAAVLIGISASLAACLGCFSNACANVHCVNPCVCFEANKYSSSSRSINSATTGNSVTSQVECPSRVDDCKYTL